jgi:transposase
MPAMITRRIVLHPQTRAKFQRDARRCKDADTRIRYRIVLLSDQGFSGKKIARALGCSTSTVSRTLFRWESYGQAGLIDRREDNGQLLASDRYTRTVAWILESTPQGFFHRRPTWTKPLLIETARQYTGVRVSTTTMGRVLKRLKARRGRPKPDAPCPWSENARKKRMEMIHALIDSLPANQACMWEDEADIDLNPRIGFDWMLPGTQRRVMTPGKNVKRYLAGAMDAQTDRVIWVRGERKRSSLFIDLLKKLLSEYAEKQVIHVILDNFVIHSSKQTKLWLAEFGGKFRLHFLPPYCPDDNRIERKVWREMHANVTVNHRCQTIEELMREAVYYLMSHNRRAQMRVRESRTAI